MAAAAAASISTMICRLKKRTGCERGAKEGGLFGVSFSLPRFDLFSPRVVRGVRDPYTPGWILI